MKKKFSRILGVALTVAMVASLFVFALPVAAQPGETVWGVQTIPTGTGNVILDASDVGDIAVSSDGTIYVINNDDGVVAAAADAVLVSTDGGQSFTGLAAVTGAVGFLSAIAVAPDDSDVAAVTDGADVFITSDGGTTWSALPGITLTGEIMDIDVSPAIPGAIFGRHYAIAVANPVAATLTGGICGAEIIGGTAVWQPLDVLPVVAPNLLPDYDYMALKFSPSYMGDRGLALVGAANPDGHFVILSQPGLAGQVIETDVTFATGVGAPTDYDASGVATTVLALSLISADIALPSDWDPGVSAGRVSYVGIGTTTALVAAGAAANRGGAVGPTTGGVFDDVYRIDDTTPVDLGGSNTVPVHSVAYSGTTADGTLFLGQRIAANVRWSLNPTSAAPTWSTTSKAPTGDDSAAPSENCTKVVVAPDGTVYAGTRDIWHAAGSDQRSAFSVSTDAGVSFNQTALIDVGQVDVDTIDSVALTPDGGTVFMGTDDTADLSLWKSATPTGSATWERIYCRTAVGGGIVRLSPDYADNPSVFWFNEAVANLWVSHDGGAVFSNRTPPAAIQDLTVESGGSAGVLYMASGTNMYKSTNGGYFFGLAIPGNAGAIISLAMAPSYPALAEVGHVLVGGTGACSYSTDGADTFTQIAGGLAGASTFIVYADEGYATSGADGENMIYAGDSLAAGTANTFRFEIGTSTAWDDMLTAAVTTGIAATTDSVVGMGISNGVFYSLSDAVWGVERTLYPLDPLGLIAWDTGLTGLVAPGAVEPVALAGAPNILTVADNYLYMPDRTVGTPVLWALNDTMATVVPVISAPLDGASILIDPVSGYGMLTTVAWAAIGSGGGLVNEFELQTDDGSGGWIGTTQFVAGVAVGDATTPSWTVGDVVTAAATGAQPTWAANQEFQLRVRCRDTINNGGLRSHWSDVISVSIQAGGVVVTPQVGPVLQGPAGGATGVSLNPGFSWTPISGATEYEFILATNATLTDTVEGTPVYVTQPSWQVPAGTLVSDTQYFWGVKSTLPTESPQSIGTFRTIAPDVFTCPICAETFTTAGALDSHIIAIHPAATPAYIWAIIVIGAVLMIAVVMLIVRTRRVV